MFDQEFFDYSLLVAFLSVFYIGHSNCCPEHGAQKAAHASEEYATHTVKPSSHVLPPRTPARQAYLLSQNPGDLATILLY